MPRKPILSDSAPAPSGGYSQAIQAGDFLFLSGQGPYDAAGERVGETIAEQVRQVLAGTLDPKDIAPHLTTDDEPQGERTMDGQAQGGSAVRRAFKRALDQLRNSGRGAPGDRP